MNIIGNNSKAKIIEERFINRVLEKEATNIFKEQDQVIARYTAGKKVTQLIKSKRRFQVSSSSLKITHAMAQRFIDMKNIRGFKRKPIPNHNKVIYGHFNNIINQLAFGLTNDVRNLLAKEYQIEN